MDKLSLHKCVLRLFDMHVHCTARSEAGTDTEADARPKKRVRVRAMSRRESTFIEAETVLTNAQVRQAAGLTFI